jgi:hypothetical protein
MLSSDLLFKFALEFTDQKVMCVQDVGKSPYIIIQGVYKLSEYFAKPHFHKHRTAIHDVTAI